MLATMIENLSRGTSRNSDRTSLRGYKSFERCSWMFKWYINKVNTCTRKAFEKMMSNARNMGANALVGGRISINILETDKGKIVQVNLYGTAAVMIDIFETKFYSNSIHGMTRKGRSRGAPGPRFRGLFYWLLTGGAI